MIAPSNSSLILRYNVLFSQWRQESLAENYYIDLSFPNQSGELLYQTYYYNDPTEEYKVYKDNYGATTPYITTNWITLDDEYKQLVRYIRVRYKSNVAMTLYTYLDGSATAKPEAGTAIAISTSLATVVIPVMVWAKQIKVKILSGSSSGSVEIHKIIIE